MRDLPHELETHLQTGATSMCRCWKVTRKDGEVLGFSDHDQDITFEGVVFDANSGWDAKALQTATGLGVDNTEASGAISSDGISIEDLSSGKYDGAEIHIWMVNWADVSQRYLIFAGFMGEITHGANAFTVELRSLSDPLNRPVGRSYLKQCSAILGDDRCGVDLQAGEFSAVYTNLRQGDDGVIYLKDQGIVESGWYTNGVVEFLSGENLGNIFQIRSDKIINDERRILLNSHLHFDIGQADQVRLSVGCDKQAVTCKNRFNNIANFQGFPFIPGEDWSLKYPKSANSVSDE
jgi:uncharacterized phage protein (TIGR02218 family)